ncbi:MAG: bacitracin ABC transporter ATP-binding protein [Pirellula sp.]|nr:bacitracin ABC transporter ATP-binding protein [Pirellula sp.]
MAGYIELYRLGKTYMNRRGPAVIVREFNLNMDEGEFVSIIGHSGCGKSTVLGMIAGLTSISEGSVIVARREISGPGPDRGVVFQAPCLLPWMTAEENVLLGVEKVHPLRTRAEQRAIALKYLALVDLSDAASQLPAALSQGMRQRVGIARALALTPDMLLLDEPLGMLDSLTRLDLQDVLCRILQQDRRSTLMVTHDIDEALFLSDRIVMMTNGPAATIGEIVEVPFPRPRMRAQVLEHPEYYALRERLIGFLEEQDAHHAPAAV